MEQQEQLELEIAAMDTRRELLGIRAAELVAVIKAAESQIDTEIGTIVAQRSALTLDLPAVVLAVSEKLRSFPRLGGKVAVSVAGGACGGCTPSSKLGPSPRRSHSGSVCSTPPAFFMPPTPKRGDNSLPSYKSPPRYLPKPSES